ncbi:TetR/AcrR family transcriptional regulator [Streptomonospora sp. S1-112]|uniref:TetR/AcrR family transcriptional regulator n=1 Tax=Streptomonospora mangrovi TaxID=2883123 RepID=A0A9X3P147_9ACTN|nr:TetR/AcrR family transcriptional regulator [Streptomonospora mangrovi]MDA0567951.1 TetR/AcrR family transcriptional regulator [Streptomonospora mangrovi]
MDNPAGTPRGTGRLRADARRNRDLIIKAATSLFAERGLDVPMEDIARRAGVGVGTLYRRFPDRESLVTAIAESTFQAVLERVRTAVAEEPDAWGALTRFLHHSLELRLSLRFSLSSPGGYSLLRSADSREASVGLADILAELVRRAQAEGSLRGDVDVGDVLILLAGILTSPHAFPNDGRGDMPNRYITLILDALRAPGASRLPGRPQSFADVRPFLRAKHQGVEDAEEGGDDPVRS